MPNQSQSTADWVDLPGYQEVLKREHEIRARAMYPQSRWFIGGEEVCPLTLDLLIELEEHRSAFVVPFKWETNLELSSQSARFVWLISKSRHAATRIPFFCGISLRIRRFMLMRRLARQTNVPLEIRDFLEEFFYDAPKAPDGAPSRSFAYWATVVCNVFAASSYLLKSEIFSMRLSELWQYYRLASFRLNPEMPRLNPSDAWAAREIEKINSQRANATQ